MTLARPQGYAGPMVGKKKKKRKGEEVSPIASQSRNVSSRGKPASLDDNTALIKGISKVCQCCTCALKFIRALSRFGLSFGIVCEIRVCFIEREEEKRGCQFRSSLLEHGGSEKNKRDWFSCNIFSRNDTSTKSVSMNILTVHLTLYFFFFFF